MHLIIIVFLVVFVAPFYAVKIAPLVKALRTDEAGLKISYYHKAKSLPSMLVPNLLVNTLMPDKSVPM